MFIQGNEIYKTVFVAFFQGEQLKSRIKKVCAGFHASLYPCPNINAERLEMLKGVRTRLEDLNLVSIMNYYFNLFINIYCFSLIVSIVIDDLIQWNDLFTI